MSTRGEAGKWNRIYREGDHGGCEAATVLTENRHLLPATGAALDAACGLGANALLLAEHGLHTSAWDISEKALERLANSASAKNMKLIVEQRDIVNHPPEPESFDVIVISRFLDRKLVKHLQEALRLDGLIFYQTFIREKQDDWGPRNPEYRLAENELLQLFISLHIVLYREEGIIGDRQKGFRNEAMLIAQRR